ncbi:tubulin-like doman-containing protein [Stenotrophomonas sp. TWI377]|uniref:tubulin-like doman-containing protein n=1 Tax=Stenotrophomonas sp. TWI377 TaxID=3136775 RepID=UPI00320B7E28
MNDATESTSLPGQPPQVTEKIRPTLFIALGGTGMKVNIRLRRRILNAIWGGNAKVENVADFPVAQFINFDLDAGEVTQDGKSVKTDVLAEQVAFTPEEKIIERLDLNKYTQSDDELRRHREVAEWFPLTPERIRLLGVDPSKGAGQIRALSRLYFFDKYPVIRDKLRDKIETLLSNIGARADKLKKLGLEVEPGKVRVVITGSAAGGTGSGSFLDMGYLAKAILKEKNVEGKVDLYMVLPGGFITTTNPDRIQANGYAALMELETALRGNVLVKHWDASDNLHIDSRPYDDVYIVDNTNVAMAKTSEQEDIYEMLSDVFFTDFTSQDFANRKRSVAVNQNQHKIRAYSVPLPQDYGDDTELRFTASYSGVGQAVLDTQVEARQNVRMNRQVQAMLKAFFGIANIQAPGNRPTDKERDDFLREQLAIVPRTFTDIPQFLSRGDLATLNGEFTHYQVADDLLKVTGDASIGAQIEQKVENAFQHLMHGSADRDQWPLHVQDVIKQLERDTKGNRVDSADRNHEVRIKENRQRVLLSITDEAELPAQIFRRLDDDERGGLDYTLALVEMIKDRLENEGTGIVPALERNAQRFAEISERLQNAELAREFERLKETTGKGLLARISGKDKQAETVLAQIKETIRDSLLFYVRSVASREAANLLRDVSAWLGVKEAVDAHGRPLWSGFVGRLQDGRQSVESLLQHVERDIGKIEAAIAEKHATLIALKAPQDEEQPAIDPAEFRQWAKEAFKDFGGSQTLFQKLLSDEGAQEVLGKLRNKAVAQLPQADTRTQTDPLMQALAALTPEQLRETFRLLLQRAMPWVPLNLNGGFDISKDRYTCLVGVKDARLFRRQYGALLEQAVPQGTGMTASQIDFVESGIPGKLICFTELSGFPVPALTPLPTYQAAYRKEAARIPLHIHKRVSQFVQPIQFTQGQYRQFAEDFKVYLHALGLGVLKRRADGKYEITLEGDGFSIGDEFSVRQSGLDGNDKRNIEEQLRHRSANVRDPLQLALLAQLFRHYATVAYKPIKQEDQQGRESLKKRFPYKLSEMLATDYRQKLVQAAGDDADRIEERARALFDAWTQPVTGSSADVYADEVAADRGDKRQVNDAFAQMLGATSLAGAGMAGQAPGAVPPPPPQGSLPGAPPPPPPMVDYSYYVGYNNQSLGPYTVQQLQQFVGTGNINRNSLLWREGIEWSAAGALPELGHLFALPSAPQPPAPPPPPSGY